jgi:hypothetical protein
VTRNPSTALEELRRLAAAGDLDRFCVDHGIRLLIAFCSAVRRDDVEPRDLDLAVLLALEGEPLYEDDTCLYARLQMATLPLLAETAWIRRLQLEQLAVS